MQTRVFFVREVWVLPIIFLPFAVNFAGIAAQISITLCQFRVRRPMEDRNGGARP